MALHAVTLVNHLCHNIHRIPIPQSPSISLYIMARPAKKAQPTGKNAKTSAKGAPKKKVQHHLSHSLFLSFPY